MHRTSQVREYGETRRRLFDMIQCRVCAQESRDMTIGTSNIKDTILELEKTVYDKLRTALQTKETVLN